jgi:para-nitrobenzyl esterase
MFVNERALMTVACNDRDFRTMCKIVCLVSVLCLSTPAAAQTAGPVVEVAEGHLRGAWTAHGASFLGIPYAGAVDGDRRWTGPTAPAPYAQEQLATRYGANCPQPVNASISDRFTMWTAEYLIPENLPMHENCLFANIWTPAIGRGRGRERKELPVMLFLHGGAYLSGSGAVPIYDGSHLSAQGIVVVTINYRLGAPGFLAHPELSGEQGGGSGDYGIKDQIAALRWLKRNVAAFGGDPERITIAGQSAGAGSVLALLAAPSAKGLFRAAIVQSVPLQGVFRPLAEAERTGADSFREWGVQTTADARKLSVATLLKPLPGTPLRFLPTADGITIPVAAESHPLASDVPVLIGYTLNDLFVPSRALTVQQWRNEAKARYGSRADAFLRYYPGHSAAQATDSASREATARVELTAIEKWVATTGIRSPVYTYLFSHVEPGPHADRFGAFHSSELPYEFDTLDKSPERHFSAVDRRVADQFSTSIANFVKQLSPSSPALPAWPRWTPHGRAIVEFADKAKVSRVVPAGADAIFDAGKPATNAANAIPDPASH